MTSVSVQHQGAVIHHRAGRFVVEVHGKELVSYPVRVVSELLLLGGTHLTTSALREAAALQIPTHFLTLNGRHVATVTPSLGAQADLLRAQVLRSEDQAGRLADARSIVNAKILNGLSILRALQPAGSLDPSDLHALSSLAEVARHGDSLAALLGIEGAAAKLYFALWRSLLPEDWRDHFPRRVAHPAPDQVNALLSFGYSILAAHLQTSLQRVGLHPGFGPYHQPHGRRPVLALDLMEEHRASVVDVTVLRFTQHASFSPDLFEAGSEVRLTSETRKVFLQFIARRMGAPLDRPLTVREVIHRQVQRFAQAARTGTPYLPFLIGELT